MLKKVDNILICSVGMGFTEDYESLAIKSHALNHTEVAYQQWELFIYQNKFLWL